MIQANGLTKYYGEKLALDHLSFTVKKGEILGLLGPNAAGKTTTMRIITGYLTPNEGDAIVAGLNIWEDSMEIKKRIGYLPELPPLYSDMTVKNYLDFCADLKGISKNDKPKDIQYAIDRTGLGNVQNRLIQVLSKGYRQRVGLAQALLGNPEILILDEPTVGLDPKQIIEIRSLIKSLAGDHTVVLSTHILPEVEMTCNRVVIINKGKIVAEDSVNNLTRHIKGSERFVALVEGDKQGVQDELKTLTTVKSVDVQPQQDGLLQLVIEAESDIRKDIAKTVVNRGFGLVELYKEKLSLEDVFLELTTKEEEVA